MAYRELPVEQYSSSKYFPTLAATSDRLDQSFRSLRVCTPGFLERKLYWLIASLFPFPFVPAMVWTLAHNSPPPNYIFMRPLDNPEVRFFYDTASNGVADIVEHYIVQTGRDPLFEFSNVTRT